MWNGNHDASKVDILRLWLAKMISRKILRIGKIFIFPHCGVETSWLSSFQTSPGGFIGNLTSILKIAGMLLLLHACHCHARPKKQKRALSYTARTLHQTNARSLSKTMSIKAPEERAQQVTGCQEGTLTGFPKLHRCNFGDFMEKCHTSLHDSLSNLSLVENWCMKLNFS